VNAFVTTTTLNEQVPCRSNRGRLVCNLIYAVSAE
jgi:hypothetical protein